RPLIEKNQLDELPVKSGTFRLSYMLSPHFLLLPRRGKSVSLSSILNGDSASGLPTQQMELI
ncbi:hypothetical protein FA412_30025, partial [Pseudomonas aeruginosa]|nr:hypothetical protein [Pseudomonas aeruginosa]